MESKFQDIHQGTRNVRDYGDKFNRLRRFAGHYLSDHDLIRRFLKGMRVELRNSCNVQDYRDVHELIKKAAEQESGHEEEQRQNQTSQNRGAKRPRDALPAAEPAPARPPCQRCGRYHVGECRAGACYNCGECSHMARECPKEKQAHRRRCYRCGQEGHLSWDCPTLQGENAGGAQPQQKRGQAARPRAYAVEGREGAKPIAGSVAVRGVTAFTLFDTGATHSFVSPRLTREWNFKGNFNTMVTGVETVGTEKMATRGRCEDVPVILAGVNLPGDLLELEVGRYEVILGMDWLAQHRAVIECAKACVRIPLDGRQIVYRGMRTMTAISVVSMPHAEEAIRKGGEAFLTTIEMVGETEAPDLGSIPVAAEYADVFEPLCGPPRHRSNAFTIELEPGPAPVSRAPYRLAPSKMAELKKTTGGTSGKGIHTP
ncbi:uncharacterized protein LOC117129307 [Brassica rapa]|uniref:uncharacterized protein LOC117129307 n=1 Tax=Brassica campestris TaxID=3711 RepID=UPI00142DCAA5|nr:uncharacterized protein LOC117129307 [Brassica rapa]